MARIAGVDIPNNKRVVISLTYVYGIGLATSKKILAAAGISEDVRVRDLTSDQEDAIRREVDAIKVEGDLRREVNLNIKRLMEIGLNSFLSLFCKYTIAKTKLQWRTVAE